MRPDASVIAIRLRSLCSLASSRNAARNSPAVCSTSVTSPAYRRAIHVNVQRRHEHRHAMVQLAGRAGERNVGNVGHFAVGAGDYDVFGALGVAFGIAKEQRDRNCNYYQYRTDRLEPDRNQDDSGNRQGQRQRRRLRSRFRSRPRCARVLRPAPGARCRFRPPRGQFLDLSTSRSLASHGMNARSLRPTSSTGCFSASLRSSRNRGSPAL